MTMDEYHDMLFQRGCGWLKWPPAVVLDTPIVQIEMALDGMIEWQNMTNGVAPKEDEPEPQEEADPAAAAKALFGALRKRAEKDGKGRGRAL